MKNFLAVIIVSLALLGCSRGSKGDCDGGTILVSYEPTSIDFGEIPIDVRSPFKGITVTNSGDVDINFGTPSILAPFSIASDSATFCDSVLKVGESCFYNISIQSGSEGAVTGDFSVTYADGLDISIPLTANVVGSNLPTEEFINATGYPPFSAKLTTTADGVIYAVTPILQVFKYDRLANSWQPLSSAGDVAQKVKLEGFSLSGVGGKLYVIGGIDGSNYINMVRAFDIAIGQWEDVTPSAYTYYSAYHTASVVDNTIYIIGGIGTLTEGGSSDTTNNVFAINVQDNISTKSTDSRLPKRYLHSATVVDKTIYIFGGNGASLDELDAYRKDLWAFNTSNNDLREVFANDASSGDVSPRMGAMMVNNGSRLYLYGGMTNNSEVLKDFLIYDINKEFSVWTKFIAEDKFPSWLKPTVDGSMVYVTGSLYAINGYGPEFSFDNTIWRYGEILAKFDNLNPNALLPPISNTSSVYTSNGDVYFIGGRLNDNSNYSADVYQYNLFTRLAQNVTPQEMPIVEFPSLANTGSSFNIFGGYIDNRVRNNLFLFDTASKSLTSVLPTNPDTTPLARKGAASVIIGNNLYMIGGEDRRTNSLKDTWKFDNTTKTWSNPNADLPVALVYHSATVIGTNIYVFGGQQTDGTIENKLYRLDTTAEVLSWVTVSVSTSDAITGRYLHSAAAVGNKLYIFGGRNNEPFEFALNDLWEIDLANPAASSIRWKEISKANMPYSRDSLYHMFYTDKILWFLNPTEYDLRYYRLPN